MACSDPATRVFALEVKPDSRGMLEPFALAPPGKRNHYYTRQPGQVLSQIKYAAGVERHRKSRNQGD